LHLKVGIEVLNGQFAGTYTDAGMSVDPSPFRPNRSDNSEISQVWPTEFYLQKKGKRWGYSLGVQSFEWGLGILSNDGYQQSVWGDGDLGNQYLRGSVDVAAGKYGRFFVALDSIIRDDNVSIYSDDNAQQVIWGFMGKTNEGEYGLLIGHRWQQDRPEIHHLESPTFVKAIPIDFYGCTQITENIVGEMELSHIRGSTNRIYSEQTRGDISQIRSMGGLFRLLNVDSKNKTHPSNSLFELGFASGDVNPTDNVSTTFYLHSNYNPGLILFEQVLPMISANALQRLTDPELVGQSTSGLRYGIGQGNISNALFVHMQDDHQLFPSFHIRTGYLWIRSITPVTDPFASAMNGGEPKGYGDVDELSNHIGSEWLVGLDYKVQGKNIEPLLRLDMAMFQQHSEFTGLDLDGLWTIHSKVQFSWGQK
jgi:hypothetical protein